MIKKIKSNLSIKVFLILCLLLSVTSLMIYFIMMQLLPKTYQINIENEFAEEADELFLFLESAQITRAEGAKKIEDFCAANNTTVWFEGPDREYFESHIDDSYLSTDDFSATEALVVSEQAFEVETNDTAAADEVSIFAFGNTYSQAAEFTDSEEETYITLSANTSSVDMVTSTFIDLLPWIIVLILFISTLGSLIVTHLLTKPIIKISGIAKKMSTLDMTWHCDDKRTDEIGTLSSSLNTLAVNLDNALNELTEANEQLQKDIEKEHEQERQRREFFRAASHELKTPVTILKGELESMLYRIGKYKDRDKYLKESLKTTERMEVLIKEILSLSKVETEDVSPDFSPINVSELLETCCLEYQPLADSKKIQIEKNIEPQLNISGSRTLLHQAFSNIINNAISYSPVDASIRAALYREKEKCILIIENTDCNIPENELEHLFNPFYRIDKSRNRTTGGSGLGLHIVKTILDLHELEYELKNGDNTVLFTIKFKLM